MPNYKPDAAQQTQLQEELTAVRHDGMAIRTLRNPSLAVQLAAVRQSAEAIRHIKDPCEEVQVAAVAKDGSAIRHIDSPTFFAQAVALVGECLARCDQHFDPTQTGDAAVKQIQDLQRARLSVEPHALKRIKDPSKKLCMLALRRDGSTIEHIPAPSEKMCRTAIQKSPTAIAHVQNPSQSVCLIAVQAFPPSIRGIRSPAESIQMAAVQKSPQTLRDIRDPCLSVCLEALRLGGPVILMLWPPSLRTAPAADVVDALLAFPLVIQPSALQESFGAVSPLKVLADMMATWPLAQVHRLVKVHPGWFTATVMAPVVRSVLRNESSQHAPHRCRLPSRL